jgi:hypothetical protein
LYALPATVCTFSNTTSASVPAMLPWST